MLSFTYSSGRFLSLRTYLLAGEKGVHKWQTAREYLHYSIENNSQTELEE